MRAALPNGTPYCEAVHTLYTTSRVYSLRTCQTRSAATGRLPAANHVSASRVSELWDFSGSDSTGTPFAGAMRPGAALFVRHVRTLYILDVMYKAFAGS